MSPKRFGDDAKNRYTLWIPYHKPRVVHAHAAHYVVEVKWKNRIRGVGNQSLGY